MFGKPLVSVIIPCYNAEKDLEACLQSVLSQDYRPLDIIVVDNDSSDGTLGIANKIAADNPLMIKVFKEKKQGAPAARNHGLRFAAGEWVQFLDADDLLRPQKISRQIAFIENHNQSFTLIAGAFEKEYLDGNKSVFLPEREPWLALSNSALGITSSNLWKKEAVLKAGVWKEEQQSSQEYELMFRMLQNQEMVGNTLEVDTVIRERKHSVSNTGDKKEFYHRWLLLRARIIDYLVLKEPEKFEKLDYALSISLLKKLQYYHQLDRETAMEFSRNYLPPRFRIRGKEMGRIYKLLFNLFGFDRGTALFWKYWGVKSS